MTAVIFKFADGTTMPGVLQRQTTHNIDFYPQPSCSMTRATAREYFAIDFQARVVMLASNARAYSATFLDLITNFSSYRISGRCS